MKRKMMLLSVPLFLLAACSTVNVNVTQSGAVANTPTGKVTSFPYAVEVGLFQGAQNIEVSKAGYESKSVKVDFNSPKNIDVTLDRIFKITSNPAGANVVYNGTSLGTTPCTVVMNDQEQGEVVFSKAGFLSAQVVVSEDLPDELTVTLDRDGSGRRLLNVVPDQNGASVKITPIHSDLEVGESSPNVASVRRLTSQPQNEYIQNFSLLPDGKSITVSIVEEFLRGGLVERRSNIWTLDASVSGAPRRAMTTGNYFDLTPNASSDAKTLFFASTRNGRFAIWSLNMKNMSGLRLVTNSNTADFSPALRPDGKELCYTAITVGSNNPSYLWSTPMDKPGMPAQLREGHNPQWSPDGSKLLFTKGDMDKNMAKIWVVDRDGGNPTQLSIGNGEYNDIDPQWSKDGKKIIFSSNRGTVAGRQNYDIWIMGADGSDLTQLTTNSSCDDKPVIAPDGKTVYFRSNRGLVWDIWVMELVDNK